MDFSHDDYRSTLRAFRSAGYSITGFLGFLADPQPRHLILRHDIDHSLSAAVRLARVDADEGIRSTFFLRVHAQAYSLTSYDALHQVAELERLGHEIELHLDGGLHIPLAIGEKESLDRQRDILEAVLGRPINGFSMHEPARMGGLDVSDQAKDRWGVDYHAYESRFLTPTMKYLSDSGARWREGHFREWIGRVPHLQVLIHPVWWFENLPQENY